MALHLDVQPHQQSWMLHWPMGPSHLALWEYSMPLHSCFVIHATSQLLGRSHECRLSGSGVKPKSHATPYWFMYLCSSSCLQPAAQ